MLRTEHRPGPAGSADAAADRNLRLAWAGFAIGCLYALTRLVGAPEAQSGSWFIDVGMYRDAAVWLTEGRSPYTEAFAALGAEYGISLPWVYPPFALLLVLWMAFVPEPVAFAVWTAVAVVGATAVMVVVSYRRFLGALPRPGFRPAVVTGLVVATLGTGPALDLLVLGQIGALLGALVLVDAVLPDERRHPWQPPRGVLTGLAGAIKLVPLAVVPYWVVTRQWRAARNAVATVGVTWAAAWLVLPSGSAAFFLEGGLREPIDSAGDLRRLDNQSVGGFVMRLLERPDVPTAVWFPLAVLVGLAGLWVALRCHRRGDEVAAVVALGIMVTLANQASWVHHAVWLVALPGILLGDGRRVRQVAAAAGAFLLLAVPPTHWGTNPFEPITQEYVGILMVAALAALAWAPTGSGSRPGSAGAPGR